MGGFPPPPGDPRSPPLGGGTPSPGAGYGDPGGGPGPTRAGFWARFAAFLVDGAVIGVFFVPAYVALVTGPTRIEACSLDSSGDIDFDGTVKNGFCEVPTGTTITLAVLLALAAFAAACAYFARTEGRTGQSLGAKALGITVVDAAGGQPIGGGRAIGRYLAGILSAVPCFLGYLWMLWDPDRQTWHDKLTNAVVVAKT